MSEGTLTTHCKGEEDRKLACFTHLLSRCASHVLRFQVLECILSHGERSLWWREVEYKQVDDIVYYKLMGDMEKNRTGNERKRMEGWICSFQWGKVSMRWQCLNKGLRKWGSKPCRWWEKSTAERAISKALGQQHVWLLEVQQGPKWLEQNKRGSSGRHSQAHNCPVGLTLEDRERSLTLSLPEMGSLWKAMSKGNTWTDLPSLQDQKN